MKFVIRLLALCTFCFLLLSPLALHAQQAVPAQLVASHETGPSHAVYYGSISGEAYGAARSTATIFQVTLNGPDDPRRFYAARSFGAARAFRFEQLPPGKYWIRVTTGAGTMIQALPNDQELYVEPGKNYVSNVEFRSR